MSRAGLGQLLVAVVKQGLQIGRCLHSGCGDLHFATNDICFAPRLAIVAVNTYGWFDEREDAPGGRGLCRQSANFWAPEKAWMM